MAKAHFARIFLCASLGAGLASCGKKASEEQTSTKQPLPTTEEAKDVGRRLPTFAIVRVPVDANGKELTDQAEMRLVTGADKISKETVEESFAIGSKPAATIDELDATTSTESYCGWLGWGRNIRGLYHSQNQNWNWTFYRPTYLNQGYSYGYNFGGQFGQVCGSRCANGGFGNPGSGNIGGNYYYYNQGFSGQGYSSSNWSPNSGYLPAGSY